MGRVCPRQALYYSLQMGKRAGIVLILETPKDRKYFIRMNSTIQHFNFPVDNWEIRESNFYSGSSVTTFKFNLSNNIHNA